MADAITPNEANGKYTDIATNVINNLSDSINKRLISNNEELQAGETLEIGMHKLLRQDYDNENRTISKKIAGQIADKFRAKNWEVKLVASLENNDSDTILAFKIKD